MKNAMRKRIPEGDHVLWVVRAEPRHDMVDVKFLITGDRETLGLTVTKSFPTNGKGVWMLREMLEACGRKVPHAVVKIDLDKFVGLECAGTVTDCGSGRMEISAFFPVRTLKKKVTEIFRQMDVAPEIPRYLM